MSSNKNIINERIEVVDVNDDQYFDNIDTLSLEYAKRFRLEVNQSDEKKLSQMIGKHIKAIDQDKFGKKNVRGASRDDLIKAGILLSSLTLALAEVHEVNGSQKITDIEDIVPASNSSIQNDGVIKLRNILIGEDGKMKTALQKAVNQIIANHNLDYKSTMVGAANKTQSPPALSNDAFPGNKVSIATGSAIGATLGGPLGALLGGGAGAFVSGSAKSADEVIYEGSTWENGVASGVSTSLASSMANTGKSMVNAGGEIIKMIKNTSTGISVPQWFGENIYTPMKQEYKKSGIDKGADVATVATIIAGLGATLWGSFQALKWGKNAAIDPLRKKISENKGITAGALGILGLIGFAFLQPRDQSSQGISRYPRKRLIKNINDVSYIKASNLTYRGDLWRKNVIETAITNAKHSTTQNVTNDKWLNNILNNTGYNFKVDKSKDFIANDNNAANNIHTKTSILPGDKVVIMHKHKEHSVMFLGWDGEYMKTLSYPTYRKNPEPEYAEYLVKQEDIKSVIRLKT